MNTSSQYRLNQECFDNLFDYLDRNFIQDDIWKAKALVLLKRKLIHTRIRFFLHFKEEPVFITRDFLAIARESKKFINN